MEAGECCRLLKDLSRQRLEVSWVEGLAHPSEGIVLAGTPELIIPAARHHKTAADLRADVKQRARKRLSGIRSHSDIGDNHVPFAFLGEPKRLLGGARRFH